MENKCLLTEIVNGNIEKHINVINNDCLRNVRDCFNTILQICE